MSELENFSSFTDHIYASEEIDNLIQELSRMKEYFSPLEVCLFDVVRQEDEDMEVSEYVHLLNSNASYQREI